jgi:hypothetical protein
MIRLNSVFLSDFQDGNMSLHASLIEIFDTSVVNLTLLYINSEAVIPASYPVVGSNRQVRGKLQRESSSETLDSPVSSTGQAQSSPE